MKFPVKKLNLLLLLTTLLFIAGCATGPSPAGPGPRKHTEPSQVPDHDTLFGDSFNNDSF